MAGVAVTGCCGADDTGRFQLCRITGCASSFLDVGQGRCDFDSDTRPSGYSVDGGPSAQAISAELNQHMPFWDRTIELVVLTHPHDDHMTGLLEVLQRYKVLQVL